MPRQYLKRLLPGSSYFARQPLPTHLASRLRDVRLWHFGRRSVSRGVGIGLFIAFIPVPFQVIIVLIAAMVLRVNLPAAFAAILVTNPLTMVPVFYLTYRLGVWMLGLPAIPLPESLTPGRFLDLLGQVWQPLLLGSIMTGIVAGVLSMLFIDAVWVLWVRCRRRRRQPA
jgi:uncharacterized protein (DUF2062 family)